MPSLWTGENVPLSEEHIQNILLILKVVHNQEKLRPIDTEHLLTSHHAYCWLWSSSWDASACPLANNQAEETLEGCGFTLIHGLLSLNSQVSHLK